MNRSGTIPAIGLDRSAEYRLQSWQHLSTEQLINTQLIPMTQLHSVVGVDSCPIGWIATVIDGDGLQTATYETFARLHDAHANADRILVDVPIGLPDGDRRRCDQDASDLLGSRGSSVFYPPCRSAAECDDYETAKATQREQLGNGLSQQAYNIGPKILDVADVVDDRYDGQVRESHPELCFAALNGQPIAYSKATDRGRGLRMRLLSAERDRAVEHYRNVRTDYLLKEVRRDDILDSMVLAVSARNESLTTVPADPAPDEPRIYYPEFEVQVVAVD